MSLSFDSLQTDLAAPSRAVPAWTADIPRTIRLTRPDILAMVEDDPDRLAWWLATEGQKEYRGLAEALPVLALEGLVDVPAPQALPGVVPGLTRLMALLHANRPDLRTAFDLSNPTAQQDFVWWYFVHGLSEYGLARFLTEPQRRFLNAPQRDGDAGSSLPVTRLMAELWWRLPHLNQAHELDSDAGRLAFLSWYYARGMTDLRLTDLLDEVQSRDLLAPVAGGGDLPAILAMIWLTDPAVRSRFADPKTQAFSDWCRSSEARETFPIVQRLFPDATAAAPAIIRHPGALPFGVNLIGYARGQFGIGEDVRMAVLAMRAAAIPFSIYNIEPGREVTQNDLSVDGLISDRRPYAVDLLCTTGIETARLAAVEGSRLFDGRRAIGYWPWELGEWPREWTHAYNLVDEVWASSRHTYEAYVRSCPKPVRHLPMVVSVDDTAGLTRRDFHLPDGKFLFVFSFDMLSSLARKNPEACIAAFRKAFPRGDEAVGLVVKVMRASTDNPRWRALLQTAAVDPRIHILDRTLNRGAVLDLYRACDCFVSLHRAEGFGRGIAEAMMLGKPVVVTGYSGNMDFTTPGTAALVGYRMQPLSREDYPFGDGQVWAEPDVDHAAWWMRRLSIDHDCRVRLSQAGQRLIETSCAAWVVGQTYAAILRSDDKV